MTGWVRAHVVKPAVLNFISGIHMVEGRNGIHSHTQTKINLIFKKLKLGCVPRNCQKQKILWEHENVAKVNISKCNTWSVRVKSCNQVNCRSYIVFFAYYLCSFLMIHYHWWTRENFHEYIFLSSWRNHMDMQLNN